MPELKLEPLRRNSRRLRDLCTLVMLGIGGPLVIAHLLVPAVTRAVSPAPGVSTGDWRASAVVLIPAVFYLWALWSIRGVFGALAEGGRLQPALAAGLTRVGQALVLGAASSVLLVTNLLRWIGAIEGGYAHFDVPGIVLGVVGLALLLLARLLEHAAAVQAELDEIV